MNWERVINHARQRPIDASFSDGHWEETPLYLACQQSPPPEAVKAIVKAYPKALLIVSRANLDLPLHIACRYQVPVKVLEELLRDFPITATRQTRWGITPIQALWEFKPQILDETFWEKIILILSAIARYRQNSLQEEEEEEEKDETIRSSNDKVADDIGREEEELLVHAAVSLGSLSCPIEVLRYVIEKYPDQVYQKDKMGQSPLHIAVGPTQYSETTKRKYKPRERDVVSTLLEKNPNAARETLLCNYNRYPLHIALTNRHTWFGGIQEILRAAPEGND